MTLVHKLSMLTAAGAVALAGIAAPAPARADNAGLVAALAGIAALAIIVDNNDGNNRGRSYNSRRHNDYGHNRFYRGGHRGDRYDRGHRGGSRFHRSGGGRGGHDGGRGGRSHSR